MRINHDPNSSEFYRLIRLRVEDEIYVNVLFVALDETISIVKLPVTDLILKLLFFPHWASKACSRLFQIRSFA